MATAAKVNLAEKLALFDERRQPKIIGTLFPRLTGKLTIQLRERDVELPEGIASSFPHGVEHCPEAEHEAHVLLIEPAGTVNTGDVMSDLTHPKRRSKAKRRA